MKFKKVGTAAKKVEEPKKMSLKERLAAKNKKAPAVAAEKAAPKAIKGKGKVVEAKKAQPAARGRKKGVKFVVKEAHAKKINSVYGDFVKQYDTVMDQIENLQELKENLDFNVQKFMKEGNKASVKVARDRLKEMKFREIKNAVMSMNKGVRDIRKILQEAKLDMEEKAV